MFWIHRLAQYRSVVLLLVLMLASFLSLVTGTRAQLIHDVVRRLVALTTYPVFQARLAVINAVDSTLDMFFGYRSWVQERSVLESEVVRLREALLRRAEAMEENQRLRRMLAFQREERRLHLIPARVLGGAQGLLEIDRGRRHGVRVPQAVITDKGVVGVVVQVYDLTATVATLHHPKCAVAAMVRRNRLRAYDGVVHGTGNLLEAVCTLDYIETREEGAVQPGDEVVTAPESLFPAGYRIGTVRRIRSLPNRSETGTLWKSAEITPAVDPYRLDEVFIVHYFTPDSEELTAAGSPADKTSDAQVPQPLQEIYAP